MKIQSKTRLSLTQHHGIDRMKVRCNEKSITITDMTGSYQGYEYDECEVSDTPTRDEIIEAVILTNYTYGREFAMIHKQNTEPGEFAQYMSFRNMAKQVATDVLSNK